MAHLVVPAPTGSSPGRDGGTPALATVAATVVELFDRTAVSHPSRPALRRRENGEWVACTWAEYARAVTEVANGLRAAGLDPGDRVAILAANRPEWHIADLGTLAAGLVSVPIYPSSSAKQVAYVLGHSQARCCFLDEADQLAKVVGRRDELPDLEFIVLLAGDHDDPDARFVRSLLDLRRAGTNGRDLASLVAGVRPTDLATIVYTSGTTGPPKGTMITHANIMATMRSLTSLIELRPDDRFLSFLPLSHITERSVSHFGQIAAGAETWFARSFATVAEDLRACRPTLFFGVPRVWEKFRQGIIERIAEQPYVLRAVASRYLKANGRSGEASRGLGARVAAAEHIALDAVVGRKLRRQLGLHRARLLACGAAPIDPELLRWFHGIGLPVAEGYGMTEVSLCTAMNRPGDIRIGTVGPPVPGVAVTISTDGEILVRGENVCAGYWRDPDASSELVDAAGWLHTGDLGQLDADGFLMVTGRKKALIITAYGKNISPEMIETRLRREPLISQAVVVGDDRPYLAALVTIDLEAAAQWAQHRGRALDLEALTEDPAFHQEISQSIERVNSEHSHAEGVRTWRVLANDFTLAAGELTPTLKVKRDVVTQRYSDVIDEMYDAATWSSGTFVPGREGPS